MNPVWSPDDKQLLLVSVIQPRNFLAVHDLASRSNHILGFWNVPGALLDPASSR